MISFVGQSSALVWRKFIQQSIKIFISEKGAFNLEYTNDSFEPFFREPVEIIMAVLNDGRYILFTEQRDGVVNVSPGVFQHVIKKYGYEIEYVALIIHNHFGPTPFSYTDKRFCQILAYNGFKGKFLVYDSSSNTIREHKYWKEKDKY